MKTTLDPFLRLNTHTHTHTHTAVHCLCKLFKLLNSQNQPKDGMNNHSLLMIRSSVTT